MKKQISGISNPDELNKRLQYTSPVTWIILGLVTSLIVGLFVWSFIYKIKVKITGSASISSHVATLVVQDGDLKKLAVGQTVYISNLEGKILHFDDNNQPVVSDFDLSDGNYTYTIIVKEMKPIEFLFGK